MRQARARRAPRPPPPRLFALATAPATAKSGDAAALAALGAGDAPQQSGKGKRKGKKKKKQGKGKGKGKGNMGGDGPPCGGDGGDGGKAAARRNKRVRVDKEVLGVRPFICVCLLHAVDTSGDARGESDEKRVRRVCLSRLWSRRGHAQGASTRI